MREPVATNPGQIHGTHVAGVVETVSELLLALDLFGDQLLTVGIFPTVPDAKLLNQEEWVKLSGTAAWKMP